MNYLLGLGNDVDEEYVTTIYNALDRNNDGRVSSDEFIDGYLEQINGITTAIQ
jgi:Ca2+-binding EF-hand superfamily protein|eukprot:CAMPEP_0168316804 /NCGR_PEP_ID=MMETSP0210-20121227/19363_1 /TAXON_ID=40633 /ORGANISM="Condylostoma magnum, Strain COL2" /LENGTH=52 /DNA_ID=CAMNT_0008304839 /DNA_START=114 /DNA_END=272 /DNA_ORIENTATION=-